ncbi:MAG: tetratricopeptide repeat protein [Bacteroidota bacterium]
MKKPITFHISYILLCVFLCCTHISSAQVTETDSLSVEKMHAEADEFLRSKPNIALERYNECMALIDSIFLTQPKDKSYYTLKKALMLDEVSYCYSLQRDYVASLESAQEALLLKESIGETYTLSNSYRRMGTILMFEKDLDKAQEYFDKAFELSQRYENSEQQAFTLVDFGRMLRRREELKQNEALEEMQPAEDQMVKAIRFTDSIQNKKVSLYANRTYANFLLSVRSDYQKALEYAKKALALSEELGYVSSQEIYSYMQGAIYRKLKQPKKALPYLKKAVDLSVALKKENTIARRYLGLSNCYLDMGDYENAFPYYRLYKNHQIKRLNIKNAREIARKDAAFTYARQKSLDSLQFVAQNAAKEKEIKQKAKTQFWSIITVLIVFILIGIITYLTLKKRAIEAEAEALRQNQRNMQLKEAVSEKTNEILTLVDENITYQRQKSQLTDNLKKLANRESDITLKSILVDLKTAGIDDSKFEMVRDNINEMSYDFKRKLRKSHPELSKTDMEISSFIRMGLSRKEIANLRNTTIYATKSSRYRLKKKLGLSTEDSLEAYLKNL